LCYSAGIITNVKTIKDRNGKHMAFVTVTNLKETIECIMFAHTFKDYKALVQKGYRVAVRGRKEDNKIIANSLEMI
jgi:DNA polymerase III alpha subunit